MMPACAPPIVPLRERYTHGPLPADRRRRDRRRGVRALRDRASPARPAQSGTRRPPGRTGRAPPTGPGPLRRASLRGRLTAGASSTGTPIRPRQRRSGRRADRPPRTSRPIPGTAGYRNPGGVGRYLEYYPPGNEFQVETRPGPRGPLRRGRRPGPGPTNAPRSRSASSATTPSSRHIDSYAHPSRIRLRIRGLRRLQLRARDPRSR